MSTQKISVLLSCDQILVRQCWKLMLSSHSCFEVVAESGTGEETIEAARQWQPAVVVIDFDMPGVDGLEITQYIHAAVPASRVVGISAYAHAGYALKVLQAGAAAYITKDSSVKELFKALTEAPGGTQYLCTGLRHHITNGAVLNEEREAPGSELTARERQIIRMIREGHSSPFIARRLSISYRTVESHRYNILKKLQLKNTVALVNFVNRYQVC